MNEQDLQHTAEVLDINVEQVQQQIGDDVVAAGGANTPCCNTCYHIFTDGTLGCANCGKAY